MIRLSRKARFVFFPALLMALGGISAHAESDPRFTPEAARAAFEKAAAPTLEDLTRSGWLTIGKIAVAVPGTQPPPLTGYWPDGKIQFGGKTQYAVMAYEPIDNAFGSKTLTYRIAAYNLRSRLLAQRGRVFSSEVTASGAYTVRRKESGVCGGYLECRIITSQKILLCADFVTDFTTGSSDDCSAFQDFDGRPIGFTGYAAIEKPVSGKPINPVRK